MGCYACYWGLRPGHDKLLTCYALNVIQFISDESSDELVVYLYGKIKCISPSTFLMSDIFVIILLQSRKVLSFIDESLCPW